MLDFSKFDFSKFDFKKLEEQKQRKQEAIKLKQLEIEAFKKEIQEHIENFPYKMPDFLKLCKIKNKQAKEVPYVSNFYQEEALKDFFESYTRYKNVRYVDAKPRQIGSTTLDCLIIFYLGFIWGLDCVVFAHVASTARNAYDKIQYAYDRLPKFWKDWNPAKFLEKGAGEIKFARGGKIDFGSSEGKDPIKGKTKQVLLATECAFYKEIDIEGLATGENTFWFYESSPNATGNLLYEKAELTKKPSYNVENFKLRFAKWWLAPEYSFDGDFELGEKTSDYINKYGLGFLNKGQTKWLQSKLAELGEQRFNKEYPPSLEVCFAENISDCFVETSYITKAFANSPTPLIAEYPLIFGIDVGHSQDKTICYIRQNVNVLERMELETDINNQFFSFKNNANNIKDKVLSFMRKGYIVDKIYIDGSDEDGKDFAKILKEIFKLAGISQYLIEDISFGSVPLEYEGKKIGKNIRESMYFKLAKWLQSEVGVFIPYHERLRDELLATTTYFDSTGNLRIKSKVEIKENLPNNRSPDDADALVLTFAGEEPNPIIQNQTIWQKPMEVPY
jgi:hypothetical protein